ncbi:MAG: hypothetical protein FIB07_12090 [Candidatus Methanoperedens sp.]|nr:hypothetical protein [Candidatus Methanoperedens sp.]
MTDDGKSDGFNFAIIAVTALLGFLSAIYIYFSNYSIEENWYSYASLLIPITFVSILYFLIYTTLHGISIKMRDDIKMRIEMVADIVYNSAFLFFLIILAYFSSLILSYTNPDKYVIIVIFIYIVIFLLIWIITLRYFSFLFCWDKIPGRDTEKLIEFLVARKNIRWAKTAVVEKIDNGSTIKLSAADNQLYLRLNKKETRANLSINNDRYSFSWNDVPGNDSGRLKKFLTRSFGIDWIKAAKIEKTDADRLIIISTNMKYLLLKLNDDKTKVDLIINGERTHEFTVNKINNLRNIYDINFKGKSFLLRFGIILISIVSLVLGIFLYKSLYMLGLFLLSFSLIIAIILYQFIVPRGYSKWGYVIASFFILFGLIIWSISFVPFSNIASGDITTDINSVYYKNGGPIPVTIHVTGPNSYISIELSKSDRENNLSKIDSIERIEPNHKSNIIISGNLSANSFENGKYGLFINPTNLSPGYYELNATRPRLNNMKIAISGFYLLNDSKSNYNSPSN